MLRFTTCLALSLLAMSFAGCNPSAPAQADPGKKANAAPVQPAVAATPAAKSPGRVLELPGVVQAFEETHLFARVPGYVLKIHKEIGEPIEGPTDKEPGELLAEIAVPELEQELKQKNELVKQAIAEVDQAQKAAASAEANIAILKAGVIEAKALQERWESEATRISNLTKNGVIDSQSNAEVQFQSKAAAARVLSADSAVLKAKADHEKALADTRVASARVEVMKADARKSETMLSYGKIRAPYKGKLIVRKVNTGDLVQPGAGKGDWLFTVARTDEVRIVIAVPETDAGLVNEKVNVEFTIPSLPKFSAAKTITWTSWALEGSSRTLRAEIRFDNKEGLLRPGMYVNARIIVPAP